MPKLSNIRIGTKLAIMSGLGVLLVAAMLATQMFGNAWVRNSSDDVVRRANLVQNILDVKASIRGMQTGVRDLRLSRSVDDMNKAKAYTNDRHKSINKYINEALRFVSIPSTVETLKGIDSLADQYAAGANDFIKLKTEMLALEAGRKEDGSLPAEAIKRLAALDEQGTKLVRERTLPLAAQMEEKANKIADAVKERMNASAAEAARQMAWNERIGLGVGAIVIVVLIGSAVFGAFLIAKPLRKMAGVLVELTNDRIVDVPYTTHGDEIGDIAKATEVFKQSVAEKVINLRVRSALDVVKSNVMVADGDYNIMYM
ncbi:MAG: hypothetical protein HY244_13265, partial [Rhizobiales bacterium]|nr:hypothetical protein [Hyphomicrobiales bacterium]